MNKGLKSPKDEQESPLGSANNHTQEGQLSYDDVGFRTRALRRVGEMIQNVWQDAYHQILTKAILVEWFGEEKLKTQWGKNEK